MLHALQEETRLVVKAAVDEALAPMHVALAAARARIDALEAKLAALPVIAPVPAIAELGPRATVVPPPSFLAPRLVEPFATTAPPPTAVPLESWVPETAVSIDYELRAVDGDRRRRRTAAAVGFAVLLVVGGMLSAMAFSYA